MSTLSTVVSTPYITGGLPEPDEDFDVFVRGTVATVSADFELYIMNLEVTIMVSSGERSFYTVSELYDILPIGRNGVYRLVNKEGFPKIVIGKRIIIPITQFWDFIDQNIGGTINLEHQ